MLENHKLYSHEMPGHAAATHRMPRFRAALRLLALMACLVIGTASTHTVEARSRRPIPVMQPASPVFRAFAARVQNSRQNLGAISASATMAAEQILNHPGALIAVPYAEQPGFAEEVLNRAGGLSNPLPPIERPGLVTPNDIIMLGVRSWEGEGAKISELMVDAKKKGWKVFVFASRAGMPDGLPIDSLIDNGATAGGEDEAPVNAIANILNMWLWACEYTAAMTRHGKYPGVLSSILAEGSTEFNKKLQSPEGRPFLGNTTTAIPAGELANAYLRRVGTLLNAIAGKQTQAQIDGAADNVLKYLSSGKTVGVSTCNHLLMSEIFKDPRTPIKPVNVVHQLPNFEANFKPGDLVVFFGYVGVSTPYEDYLGSLNKAKLDLIACIVPDKKEANNSPGAVGYIFQHWQIPDAEVPVPFPPGRMAPVSGIDEALMYRMLEEAVATRLAAVPQPAKN